jgi:hypothetical protein
MATSLNDESAQLNRQVADDFELLELMLDEIKKSPKEYQPTNYIFAEEGTRFFRVLVQPIFLPSW